jgi:hypothetical protein
MANGATRKARSARPARRHAAERRARRLRVRVLWSAPREIVTWGMMGVTPVCPGRQFPATPTRQHWDSGTLFLFPIRASPPNRAPAAFMGSKSLRSQLTPISKSTSRHQSLDPDGSRQFEAFPNTLSRSALFPTAGAAIADRASSSSSDSNPPE